MASRFESTFNARVVPASERAFGVSVTLSRGPRVTSTFTARRSDIDHATMGAEYGLEVKVTMRHYLLPVASLVIDGDTIAPRTGDRITEGTEVWEIQPPDDRQASTGLLSGGYDYRVFCKRVE